MKIILWFYLLYTIGILVSLLLFDRDGGKCYMYGLSHKINLHESNYEHMKLLYPYDSTYVANKVYIPSIFWMVTLPPAILARSFSEDLICAP